MAGRVKERYLALNVGDLGCLLNGRDIALKLLWG